MKKTILTFGAAIFMSVSFLSITSCDTSKTQETQVKTESEVQYMCPMKCEGDKTYSEKGICPICEMDLKELKS